MHDPVHRRHYLLCDLSGLLRVSKEPPQRRSDGKLVFLSSHKAPKWLSIPLGLNRLILPGESWEVTQTYDGLNVTVSCRKMEAANA